MFPLATTPVIAMDTASDATVSVNPWKSFCQIELSMTVIDHWRRKVFANNPKDRKSMKMNTAAILFPVSQLLCRDVRLQGRKDTISGKVRLTSQEMLIFHGWQPGEREEDFPQEKIPFGA